MSTRCVCLRVDIQQAGVTTQVHTGYSEYCIHYIRKASIVKGTGLWLMDTMNDL